MTKIIVYPNKKNIQIMAKYEDHLLLRRTLSLHKTNGFLRNLYKKLFIIMSYCKISRSFLPFENEFHDEYLVKTINVYYSNKETNVKIIFLIGRSTFKKNILKVYDCNYNPIAVVKHATCEFTNDLVKNEIKILSNLPVKVKNHSPKLIATMMLNNNLLFIQQYIKGRLSTTNNLTSSHYVFLKDCISDKSIDIKDSYLHYSKIILPNAVQGSVFSKFYSNILTCEALRHLSIYSTVEHGDFTPTNIMNENTVVDWEHGIVNGFPLFDLFYFYEKIGIDLYELDKINSDEKGKINNYISLTYEHSNNISMNHFRQLMYKLYTVKQSIREINEGMEVSENGFSLARDEKIKLLNIKIV